MMEWLRFIAWTISILSGGYALWSAWQNNRPAIKKFERLFKNKKSWALTDVYNSHEFYYHTKRPEFTIEDENSEDSGYMYYLLTQCNSSPNWYDMQIKYNKIVLREFRCVCLDSGRLLTPVPKNEYLREEKEGISEFLYKWDGSGEKPDNKEINYGYFIKKSLTYKLHEFLYEKSESSEKEITRNRFLKVILVFNSKKEKERFDKYVLQNLCDFNKKVDSEKGYYEDVSQNEEYNTQLKRMCSAGIVLNQMLKEFREKANKKENKK